MIFSVTAQQFYKLSFGLVDNNKKKEIMIGLFNHLFASANGPDRPLVITNHKNVRLGSHQVRRCGENTVYRPFSIRPGPAAGINNDQKLKKLWRQTDMVGPVILCALSNLTWPDFTLQKLSDQCLHESYDSDDSQALTPS